MLSKRIIPCLDVREGRTTKGIKFQNNVDVGDPVEMAKVFKEKIHHIHWKDLGEEWVEKRGTEFGCGFSTIALGDGVVDIKGVCDVLKDCDIKSSTLEIVGTEETLLKSVEYLRSCGI